MNIINNPMKHEQKKDNIKALSEGFFADAPKLISISLIDFQAIRKSWGKKDPETFCEVTMPQYALNLRSFTLEDFEDVSEFLAVIKGDELKNEDDPFMQFGNAEEIYAEVIRPLRAKEASGMDWDTFSAHCNEEWAASNE